MFNARDSWYATAWVEQSPLEFLIDTGHVASALSRSTFDNLTKNNDIVLAPLKNGVTVPGRHPPSSFPNVTVLRQLPSFDKDATRHHV